MRATLFLISLSLSGAIEAAEAPSYARDVAPIFASNCAGCHNASAKLGNLNLETLDYPETAITLM